MSERRRRFTILADGDCPLADDEILRYVLDVVEVGRISGNDDTYCRGTVFTSTLDGSKVVVTAARTRAGGDSFHISHREADHE